MQNLYDHRCSKCQFARTKSVSVDVLPSVPEEQKSHALTGVGAPSGPPLFWHANPPWKEGVAGPEDMNPMCKATSPTQRDARDGSDDDDNSEEEDRSEAKKSKKKKKIRSRKRAQETSDAEVGPGKVKCRKGKKGSTEDDDDKENEGHVETAPPI